MQSLSKKRHEALMVALAQVEEMLGIPDATSTRTDLQRLDALYDRYENLLAELDQCIAEYQQLYKDVRIYKLAPGLRTLRNRMDKNSPEYKLLSRQIQSVRIP